MFKRLDNGPELTLTADLGLMQGTISVYGLKPTKTVFMISGGDLSWWWDHNDKPTDRVRFYIRAHHLFNMKDRKDIAPAFYHRIRDFGLPYDEERVNSTHPSDNMAFLCHRADE